MVIWDRDTEMDSQGSDSRTAINGKETSAVQMAKGRVRSRQRQAQGDCTQGPKDMVYGQIIYRKCKVGGKSFDIHS